MMKISIFWGFGYKSHESKRKPNSNKRVGTFESGRFRLCPFPYTTRKILIQYDNLTQFLDFTAFIDLQLLHFVPPVGVFIAATSLVALVFFLT